MIGLKRGDVKLSAHENEWEKEAEQTIVKLKKLLGDTAVDIQHIGSTAVSSIHAKPIIDIAVGVYDLNDIIPFKEKLRKRNYVFRGEDVPGQILFVKGDAEKDIRTHHIHIVKHGSDEWNNYINFRDYLNAFPEKAMIYDLCKQDLAKRFPNERGRYTEGKKELVESLIKEAALWRSNKRNY